MTQCMNLSPVSHVQLAVAAAHWHWQKPEGVRTFIGTTSALKFQVLFFLASPLDLYAVAEAFGTDLEIETLLLIIYPCFYQQSSLYLQALFE